MWQLLQEVAELSEQSITIPTHVRALAPSSADASTHAEFSLAVCSLLELAPSQQQLLLECTCTGERLASLSERLAGARDFLAARRALSSLGL